MPRIWGYAKRKIKDAYPKKVCHMLRYVKKRDKRCIPKEGMSHAQACQKKEKKKREKRQPLIQKERRDGAYKGVHTPSTKNIHTLAHLDQGL